MIDLINEYEQYQNASTDEDPEEESTDELISLLSEYIGSYEDEDDECTEELDLDF